MPLEGARVRERVPTNAPEERAQAADRARTLPLCRPPGAASRLSSSVILRTPISPAHNYAASSHGGARQKTTARSKGTPKDASCWGRSWENRLGGTLLRRLLIAGMAAALATPVVTATPSSATILFSCSSARIETGISPGLSHNPTAQTVSTLDFDQGSYITGCGGGGGYASLSVGTLHSFPPRPLGCPESQGGAAGNNYPDQTPLLIGGDPSFTLAWATGPASTGLAKVKSAGDVAELKIVFVITAGQFSPPAGQKTKLKGSIQLDWVYYPPFPTNPCADDSNPAQLVSFTNAGSLFVNQQ